MASGSNVSYTGRSLWTEALSVSVPNNQNKKVKIKKSDQIKNQIFLDGSELVADEYWKDLLIKAAKGKFPRGFAFNDGYLLHRGSGISIQIPEDPTGLVGTVVLFMREKGNIFSPNDLAILESVAQQHLIDGEDSDVAWARIFKCKNSRAKYIRDFVERTYCLFDMKIRDEFYTQVNTYLELGFMKKEDLIFHQGYIQAIDGLTITDKGKVEPTRPLTMKVKSSKPASVEERKPVEYRHYENWEAAMQKYHKYIVDSKSTTIATPNLSNQDT